MIRIDIISRTFFSNRLLWLYGYNTSLLDEATDTVVSTWMDDCWRRGKPICLFLFFYSYSRLLDLLENPENCWPTMRTENWNMRVHIPGKVA